MIYLITFASGRIFEDVQKKFDNTIDILGADKHIKYSKEDIVKTDFYRKNSRIFRIKAGFGLYIWKPYIIFQELKKINFGDYLFYCDCSRHAPIGFTTSIKHAIAYMEANNIDIMPGATHSKINLTHTSDHCITVIKKTHNFDVASYKKSLQHMAGHIIIKKTERSMKFIAQWLKYCQVWKCIRKNRTKHGFNNCDMAVFNVLLFIYSISNPNKSLTKNEARNHNIYLSQFLELKK